MSDSMQAHDFFQVANSDRCGLCAAPLEAHVNYHRGTPIVLPPSPSAVDLEAIEVAVKWMGWWTRQNECSCEDHHVCGLPARRKEMQAAKDALSRLRASRENTPALVTGKSPRSGRKSTDFGTDGRNPSGNADGQVSTIRDSAPALVWTKEKPTVDGYYLWRAAGSPNDVHGGFIQVSCGEAKWWRSTSKETRSGGFSDKCEFLGPIAEKMGEV